MAAGAVWTMPLIMAHSYVMMINDDNIMMMAKLPLLHDDGLHVTDMDRDTRNSWTLLMASKSRES